jgi:predicted enzyme related to lactoylglutathione lyase
MARINFVELPVRDIAAARSFYERAFAMEMTAFGPTYACTMTGDVDLGLQADASEATETPLAVLQVDNLETALAAVIEAGGQISKPIFAFPGGRRFHFIDPAGNELSAMQIEQSTV